MGIETLIDRPGAVRAEDALDTAAIDGFLKARVPGLVGMPEVAQYPGGASNLTYLLRYANRDLILRRPPTGVKAKSAHDVLREARIIAGLKPVYPYVPAIVAFGEDQTIIGCDFYVMERLVGIIPRRDLPAGLDLGPDRTRLLCTNVLDKLIELHAIDPVAAGLGGIGKGAGYVRRQVEGWSGRWQAALTDDVAPLADVVAWLDRVTPESEVAIRLIHNDFRFDNVVLDLDDPLRVIGVLDWEMATLGDPLMDLGGALAYWVQADDDPTFVASRRQPTNAPGMLTRAEVIAYYGEKTGVSVETFDFYEVFGLFRLAVIIQQIYRRYVLKQTTNERYASYGAAVNNLGRRCQAAIATSTL
jgi:aminoglycoside phosphotransferase (APT) family kinase protein